MFTGLVEEIGKIQSVTSNSIYIAAQTIIQDLKVGDSVAVNGVCLTVTKISDGFYADLSWQTIKSSNLKELKAGAYVNLERALKVSDRLGGHIVSGHIDDTAAVLSVDKKQEFYDISVKISQNLEKYVAEKGSIALNGISLTVANLNNGVIKIAVIPHTYENTNLKYLKTGDNVNIETDILAKYVEKFLSTSDNKSGISINFLKENGFC